jgi:hypothetical protein
MTFSWFVSMVVVQPLGEVVVNVTVPLNL